MDPLVIMGLVFQYGLPFVSGLIEKAKKKEMVSIAEWDALLLKIETPGEELIPPRPV